MVEDDMKEELSGFFIGSKKTIEVLLFNPSSKLKRHFITFQLELQIRGIELLTSGLRKSAQAS